MNQRYSQNVDYFSTKDNLDACYWAGFISADGYIKYGKTGRRALVFHLASKDKNHLEEFKSCADITNPIYDKGSHVYLEVYADKICQDLQDNFNVVTKKSLTIKPPDLSGEFSDAFAVGYIDGNGWIYNSKLFVGLGVCTGSWDMIIWLCRYFPGVMPRKRNNGNYYQMDARVIGRTDLIDRLVQLPVPKLERKWNILKERYYAGY